jgi:ABC-type transport system substrate-binding protein
MHSTPAVESTLVAVALALVSLGGCSSPLEAPISAAHPNDETPRRGGTLHLATFGDLSTLDPAASADSFSASVIRLIYAGLVDFDASGKVVPDLAAAIEEADDGRTYRFALREGARFQDGTEVTAAEVKRSFERALHPTTPSPASYFEGIEGFAPFSEQKAPHLDGIVVEGRYLIAIHLRERDATFLQLLALANLRLTCPSAGERYTPTWAPCGAGPFKLPTGGWERNRTLTLVRNESYFRPGVPYLAAVTWELVSTQIAEGLKFARGDLDLIGDLNHADTVRYQADPRWQLLAAYDPPSHIVQGDAMNTEIPPFDNVEVRRAVAAAIDREHIVLLRASNLTLATKPVPPLPAYEPPPIGQTHDLASALEHMRKAGYAFDPATGRGGWPAPVSYDTNRQGFSESTGVLVQQDLAKIGIQIALRVSSLGTWTALTHHRGKSAMSPQGWHEDYPDPRNFLEPRFGTKSIGEENGLNYSFYSNPRVDTLLERARRELDAAARTGLYADVERILCDEAPWAFEYSFRFYQVRQPYVRGYRTHAMWTGDVIPIWLDRARERETEERTEAPLARELLGSLSGPAR